MYLSKELVKVCLLALVSFTLVMTTFAIIEPLRKRGLDSQQVISLFTITLPVMFSLTLPVAALFATTIVYGRFSQDNELMACRASGISTITLLQPAMVLGVVVTCVSLMLSNFVTPRITRLGEEAIKANFRNFIYHEMASQGYFRVGDNIIRADDIDTKNNVLTGVVYADVKKRDNIRIVTAASAQVNFSTQDGQTFVNIHLDKPLLTETGNQQVAQEDIQPIQSIPIYIPPREKARFNDWDQMVRYLADLSTHSEVKGRLDTIRMMLKHDRFTREVAGVINSGKAYDQLRNQNYSYSIRAPKAVSAGDEVGLSSGATPSSAPAGGMGAVEVTEYQNGKPTGIFRGDSATLKILWLPKLNQSQVSISMKAPRGRSITVCNAKGEPLYERIDWSVGQLAVPMEMTADIDNLKLDDIESNRQGIVKDAADPTINRILGEMQADMLPKLRGSIIGEMHLRMAYGLSCLLLVTMGGALGLIYRGGQIISAFALTAIPAFFVIVLIMTGKELCSNPGVQARFGFAPGLAAIWGGIMGLLVADIIIYVRLMRR